MCSFSYERLIVTCLRCTTELGGLTVSVEKARLDTVDVLLASVFASHSEAERRRSWHGINNINIAISTGIEIKNNRHRHQDH